MKRTIKQNNSIHKWFEEVARDCQHNGVTQRMLLDVMDIDNTPVSIKMFFQQIAKIKFGKEHTRELTTKEITECYEEFNKALAMRNIHVPFPSYMDSDEYLNSYVQNS